MMKCRKVNVRNVLMLSALIVAFVSVSVGCASAGGIPLFTYTGDVLPSADGWSIVWYEDYESTCAQIEDGVLHLKDPYTYSGSGLSYYRGWPTSPDCINVAEFDVKVVSCSGIMGVYIGINDADYNMVYNLFPDRIQSRYAITNADSSKDWYLGGAYYFDTTAQYDTYKAIIDNGIAKLYINGELVLDQPAGTGTYRGDWPSSLDYSNGVEFGVAGSPTTGEAYFDEVRTYCTSNPELIPEFSTVAPITVPTSTPTSTPIPTERIIDREKQAESSDRPASIPQRYVIGATVLALILIAGIDITRKRKSNDHSKPQPPAPPQSTPDQKSPSPSPHASAAKPIKQLPAIEIKRGYEVLPNNDLRFGIRIKNNTEFLIADVETKLDFPKTLFTLKGDLVQSLANIHPNGERTATYVLTPRGCIHNEDIEATAFYRDHTGKQHTLQIRPKEVHCVCPFLKEKAMREGEFAELTDRGEHIQEGLSFSGISVNKIAEFIKESCAHRLYVISEHEVEDKKIINLAGESLGEKAYYLLTAVIQPHSNVTQVALRAYSDKPYGLHGFLNEIANSVRHLVSSVQSAKEIGIIESTQVITIIDSVVQRTSFGGTGEGPGATGITIEGSVVQRSAIEDGAEKAKKCSHCGTDMPEDERFCPNCGTQMK